MEIHTSRSSSRHWIIGILSFIAGAVVFFGVHAILSHSMRASGHGTQTEISDQKLALYQNMRKLWADHVIWTREYVIGAIDGTASVEFAAKRLLENQEDIGSAIVPFYGQEAGGKLTELLKEHILIAVDLIEAAKTDDQEAFADINAKWYRNAADISTFLGTANPHWPKDELVEAMNMHLETTTNEAVARLTKDYEKDVIAFDAVFDHMMIMSDVLSAGIIAQFPEKF